VLLEFLGHLLEDRSQNHHHSYSFQLEPEPGLLATNQTAPFAALAVTGMDVAPFAEVAAMGVAEHKHPFAAAGIFPFLVFEALELAQAPWQKDQKDSLPRRKIQLGLLEPAWRKDSIDTLKSPAAVAAVVHKHQPRAWRTDLTDFQKQPRR